MMHSHFLIYNFRNFLLFFPFPFPFPFLRIMHLKDTVRSISKLRITKVASRGRKLSCANWSHISPLVSWLSAVLLHKEAKSDVPLIKTAVRYSTPSQHRSIFLRDTHKRENHLWPLTKLFWPQLVLDLIVSIPIFIHINVWRRQENWIQKWGYKNHLGRRRAAKNKHS
jgi:hypothetical protein